MSTRNLLYGLFLTTAMWACGRTADEAERAENIQKARLDTESILKDSTAVSPTDYAKQKKALEQNFPDIYKRVKKNINNHLLLASPMENGVPNQFSIRDARKMIGLLDNVGKKPFDDITVDVLEMIEGKYKRRYLDSEKLPTIGIGTLMPKPRDP